MRVIILKLLLLACSWWAVAAAAAAQAAPADAAAPAVLERLAPMQGYYYTFGLHGGLLQGRDAGKNLRALAGTSLSLHIGQSVTTWMDLGAAIEIGLVVAGERSGTIASLGIDWTLRPISALFLRLTPGIGVSQISAVAHSDNTANTFGAALSVTLGYALFPFHTAKQSGGFAISPVVRLSTVQPFSDTAAFWLMAGFEIGRWTGLPERQLDVPLRESFAARAH